MSQLSRVPSPGAIVSASESDLPCFGNWRAVCQLGQGRWSTVYRARPEDRMETAAAVYVLKTVRTDVQDHPTAVRLLRREAYVARTVAHPHLTCILAAQTKHAPQYLVMPYLEGTPLNGQIGEGLGMDTPHALWIVRQTAEAMDALHAQGWLHSDIKPANIFVSIEGHVTLLDLGLVRKLGPIGHESDWAVTGTLAYTAPEFFATVLEIGPSSDVYSLGVTLYEMLTGRLPFSTRDAAELVTAHTHRTPPDPRVANPQISSGVVQLLRRMLAKQPDHRPAVDELIAWLLELEIDTFDERTAA